MNKPNNQRRSRGRPQGKRSNQRGKSNQNQGRPRVNPKPQLEKYRNLARDAEQAGDRILAENYWQHMEHYQRLLNEMYPNNRDDNSGGDADEDGNAVEGDAAADSGNEEQAQPQKKPSKAARKKDLPSNDPAEAEQPREVRPEVVADVAEAAPKRAPRRKGGEAA